MSSDLKAHVSALSHIRRKQLITSIKEMQQGQYLGPISFFYSFTKVQMVTGSVCYFIVTDLNCH